MDTTPDVHMLGGIRALLVVGTEPFTKGRGWTAEGIEEVAAFCEPFGSTDFADWMFVSCSETPYGRLATTTWHKAWWAYAQKHNVSVDLQIRTTQRAGHSGWLSPQIGNVAWQPHGASVGGKSARVIFLARECFEAEGLDGVGQYVLRRLDLCFGSPANAEETLRNQGRLMAEPEIVLEEDLLRYTKRPQNPLPSPVLTVIRHQPEGTLAGERFLIRPKTRQ